MEWFPPSYCIQKAEKLMTTFSFPFPEAEQIAASAGIHKPWRIASIRRDSDGNAFHVDILAQMTSLFPCPRCKDFCPRVDDEDQERVWRHVDLEGKRVYFHCRRPRIKCPRCGIHVTDAPWARKSSRYTLAFEKNCVALLEHKNVYQTSRALHISRVSVSSIAGYWREHSEE